MVHQLAPAEMSQVRHSVFDSLVEEARRGKQPKRMGAAVFLEEGEPRGNIVMAGKLTSAM